MVEGVRWVVEAAKVEGVRRTREMVEAVVEVVVEATVVLAMVARRTKPVVRVVRAARMEVEVREGVREEGGGVRSREWSQKGESQFLSPGLPWGMIESCMGNLWHTLLYAKQHPFVLPLPI
jgi:hypothetical protein